METKGKLDQDYYWIYETYKGNRHVPLFGMEPRTLMVFRTRRDGAAFKDVFLLLPFLTFRRVSRQELQEIIDVEFMGNYVILEAIDVFVVGSRYESLPLADYGDVPDG